MHFAMTMLMIMIVTTAMCVIMMMYLCMFVYVIMAMSVRVIMIMTVIVIMMTATAACIFYKAGDKEFDYLRSITGAASYYLYSLIFKVINSSVSYSSGKHHCNSIG